MLDPERINIHELTVEEPEKQTDLPFDPERDVTEEDWQVMRNELKKAEQENNWSKYASIAMAIKILNPEIEIDLNERIRQGILKELNFCKKNHNWEPFYESAVALKTLGLKDDLNRILGEDVWQGISNDLERVKNGGVLDFSHAVSFARILDPDNSHLHIDMGVDDWKKMNEDLEKFRNSGEWFNFSAKASNMRILDPEIKINIGEKDWEGIKNLLNQSRGEEEHYLFYSLVIYVKVIAAEKVEVTDQGLIITMPKKKEALKPETPSIPETKQF